MAISPILLNATIQQTNDVLQNQTRQVEKGMLDQGNIVTQETKQEYQKARQVVRSEQSFMKEERFDAKEKGNGNYQGDGGKNKKKKSQDGKVITKPEGGFDMKI
ncbi:MAG: hypothetical protein II273_01575 [Lachnospiraceae bacterium]|nr:hypothetical protein [Lachnospiraceae bacterium]MEE1257448.1 hypothetical protein [Lachnospiraceae bacterium]